IAAACASPFDRSAEAALLEIVARLETWAAVAVALPGGATSAAADRGVRPMRRHAGAAAESTCRRMVLLPWRLAPPLAGRHPRPPGRDKGAAALPGPHYAGTRDPGRET